MFWIKLRLLTFGTLIACASCGTPAEEDSLSRTESSLLAGTAYQINGTYLSTNGQTDVGAAIFNNALYYAYVGTDGRIGVVIDHDLADHERSITSYALTDTTNYGPALVVYNGMLHLAYVGTNGDLYVLRSSDGINWEPAVDLSSDWRIGSGWQFAPCLSASTGAIQLFSVATFDNHLLFVALDSTPGTPVSLRGVYFSGRSTNNEFTSATPSCTIWNGDLYLSWAGTADNKPVYVKHYSSSTGWSSPTIVTGAFGRPSVFPTTPSLLTIVYRGNDAVIYSVGSGDGVTFGSSFANNPTTDHTPVTFMYRATGAYGPVIWTAYSGQDNLLYTFPMRIQ